LSRPSDSKADEFAYSAAAIITMNVAVLIASTAFKVALSLAANEPA
jgi:hypothetical protein